MQVPVLGLPEEHVEDALPPLPTELLLALSQRFERDQLDEFAFNTASTTGEQDLERVLNDLVPDESALLRMPQLSVQLEMRIELLRDEIDELYDEARRDQDPARMHDIQEHIGVS